MSHIDRIVTQQAWGRARQAVALAAYAVALLLIVATLLTIAAMDHRTPLVWRVDERLS